MGGGYDFVCLIPKDFSTIELCDLKEQGLLFKHVEPIHVQSLEQINGLDNPWNNTFLKLRMFELTEYDKVIYLDSDMVVKQSIKRLFDLPHLSAVPDGEQFTGLTDDRPGFNSGMIVFVPENQLQIN